MDRNVPLKMSGPPGSIDCGFDPACRARVQVIGTDHRSGAASAWLETLDNEGSRDGIGNLEHMGDLRALFHLAREISHLLC